MIEEIRCRDRKGKARGGEIGPLSGPSDVRATIPRRSFLTAGGAAVSALALPTILTVPRSALADTGETRWVKLYQPHTGESFEGEYRIDGRVPADARRTLNWFLRDHHTDIATSMDFGTLDLVYRLQGLYRRARGHTPTVNIHSAYRTRSTNDNLLSEGAALNSYHLRGQAVDVSVQGYGIYILANFAQRVGAGGLGVYWRGNFVHVDTGPARFWYRR